MDWKTGMQRALTMALLLLLVSGCGGGGGRLDTPVTLSAGETSATPVAVSAQEPAQDHSTQADTVTVSPIKAVPTAQYAVAPHLAGQTADFYKPVNAPFNQSKFGICETCSSMGLLGYAWYGNTNKISPMYTLFNAYANPDSTFTTKPGRLLAYYLWYTPRLSDLWSFCQTEGVVVNNRPPLEGDSDFTNLYAAYAATGATFYTLAGTTAWQAAFNAYARSLYEAQVAAVTLPTIVAPNIDTFAGDRPSVRIVNALEDGNLVLVMIKNVYKYQSTGSLFGYYTYDTSTGTLNATPTNTPEVLNNLWDTPPTGSYVGGDHWVYIFSYATSGSATMFFVRNSWGTKRGENGNYYMTADYVDGTFVTQSGTKYPLLQDGYAVKITPH